MITVRYNGAPTGRKDPEYPPGFFDGGGGSPVLDFIKKHKLPVSKDERRVRMIKATDQTGTTRGSTINPGQRTKWEVGGIVEAEDYKPEAKCGHGLHFAYNVAEARRLGNQPRTGKSFVVDVELDDALLVDDYNGPKLKAKRCKVLWEGTEENFDHGRIGKLRRWGVKIL